MYAAALFFASADVSATCASASAVGVSELFLYRAPGDVVHGKNGRPAMNISIAETEAESEALKKTHIFLAKLTHNASAVTDTGFAELAISANRRLFVSSKGDEGKKGSDSARDIDDEAAIADTAAAERALEGWYAAGYAEGYATMASIADVVTAHGGEAGLNADFSSPTPVAKWMASHADHLSYQVLDTSVRNLAPFYLQARKHYVQMVGIADGYNARREKESQDSEVPPVISFDTVYRLNLHTELAGIKAGASVIFGSSGEKTGDDDVVTYAPLQNMSHSTLYVTRTQADLLVGHVAAAPYNIFVGRVRKTYVMETAVVMTSRAGIVHSGGRDAWYQTSQQLVVASTGLSCLFTSHDRHVRPTGFPAFVRALAATFTASSGKQWATAFRVGAVGTLSAQWTIVDYKLYTKADFSDRIAAGTVWITEEMPGKVRDSDATTVFKVQGYFATTNLPFHREIFEAAGYAAVVIAYGDYYGYYDNPRQQMLRRDHAIGKVNSVETMLAELRYNDWENDELSTIPNCPKCSPQRSPLIAFSPRADLVPANASFGDLNPLHAQTFASAMFGAVDAKVANYDGMVYFRDLSAAAIVTGPTAESRPAFSWQNHPDHPYAKLPGMPQGLMRYRTIANAAPAHAIPAQLPQPHARERVWYATRRRLAPITFTELGVPAISIDISFVQEVDDGVDGRGKDRSTEDTVHLATARYHESGLVNGYDRFDVAAPSAQRFVNDDEALATWYAAGLLEGYATAQAIEDVRVWRNYTYTAGTLKWVEKHIAYMRSNALTRQSPFWRQVRKQLVQMHGIAAGVNYWRSLVGGRRIYEAQPPMTFLDVFMINFRDDNDDVIVIATAPKEVREELRRARQAHRGDHCSALVKVTDDDVLLGQATWASYAIAVRKQIKTYAMEHTVTFSCNAAMIFSGDDWYQTSHSLAVQETTNEFKNPDLYDLIKPECVSYFMRVMVANYLATTAQEWVALYSTEPAGTYCNQWMIFDFNKFDPTAATRALKLADNAFWILEELPGLIESADMTERLRADGYWASYNVPYFNNIANVSGFTDYYNKYGDFYSWERTPRANIFRRDQHKVTNVTTLRALMRYNDWQNDPLSAIPNCTACVPKNSPICAIASRADLVPSDAVIAVPEEYRKKLEFGLWGAPDVKVSAYTLIRDGFAGSHSLSPSNVHLPTFSWNAYPDNALAYAPGVAQYYAHETPAVMRPEIPSPAPAATEESFYVYRLSGDGVPAPTTSIPNITFEVTRAYDAARSGTYLGRAGFKRSADKKGADELTVSVNPALFKDLPKHPLQGWYAAGLAEGYATMQQIKRSLAANPHAFPDPEGAGASANGFIVAQLHYIRTCAENRTHHLREAYWRQVRKQLLQMEGIVAGYNHRAGLEGEASRISIDDIFRLNLLNEKDDIYRKFSPNGDGLPRTQWKVHQNPILVKVTETTKVETADLYIGHNGGGSYAQLASRQYKSYRIEGSLLSMTTNAGRIASSDGWYLLPDAKLAVLKGPLDVFVRDRFASAAEAAVGAVRAEAVPTFMRELIASYVSEGDVASWPHFFGSHMSGTDPAQFALVDYRKFDSRPGATLRDGLLTVVEHIGLKTIVIADQTSVLRREKHWAGIGIPLSDDVAKLAGYDTMASVAPAFFDRATNPRAALFAARQGEIGDWESLHKVMRSSAVPASSAIPDCPQCDPAYSPLLAAAPRGDLIAEDAKTNYANPAVMDPRYAALFLQQGATGTVDTKVVTARVMALAGMALMTVGPAPDADGNSFSWSSPLNRPYIASDPLAHAAGMPQTFAFEVFAFAPDDAEPPAPTPTPRPANDGERSKKIVIGVIVTGLFTVTILGAILYGWLRHLAAARAEKEAGDAESLVEHHAGAPVNHATP